MQTEALVAPVVQEIRVCGAFCRKPLLLSRFCHRKCKQLSVGVGAGWVHLLSAGSLTTLFLDCVTSNFG